MRHRIFAACVSFVACTSAAPLPGETPRDAPLPEPPSTPSADDLSTLAPEYWQWDDVGEPGRVFALGARGSYELSPAETGVSVEFVDPDLEVRWTTQVGEAHHDSGDFAIDAERLYVAHHDAISSGASVTALSLGPTQGGSVLWTTVLEGLGPIDHSKYRNRVQLSLGIGPRGERPELLSVYGHESSGRYTEVLDAATGKRLSNRRIDDSLAEIERRPHRDDFEFPTGPSEVVLGDSAYTFEEKPGPDGQIGHAILVREGSGGWTRRFPGDGQCGNAALREHADRLYLVRWCAISSGASLTVLAKKTGATVTQRPLRALGPVAHSEYMNVVEIDFVQGHLAVFGSEAHGDYVEIVDPISANTLVSRTFRGD